MRPYVKNEYIFQGPITYINIQFKGIFYQTIIDTEMYPLVSQYHWRLTQKRNKFYAVTGESKNGQSQIYLHWLCYRSPFKMLGYEIDHINGNSLDNRICNLRMISRQENIDNTRVRRDSKLQIRGISFDEKYNSFVVDFSFHKKRFYVKPWKTLEEAVYCRFCLEKYFGMTTLENNPVAVQYLNKISEIDQIAIKNYVQEKISGN